MSIQLRQYQLEIIEAARQTFAKGKCSPLIVAPTGSGKTVMFSEFTHQLKAKGRRVLILAHRDELLDQISESLNNFNVEHSVMKAGSAVSKAQVVVGSVMTCVRREMPSFDFIIHDESHHVTLNSGWGKIIKQINPKWMLGVTATPCRLDGAPLGEVFDSMILAPSTRWLINNGYLSSYRAFAASSPNLKGVKSRAGDFISSQVEELMNTPQITGSAIKEYELHANGKRAIVFCSTVKHAEQVRDEFLNAGHSAESLDGTMDKLTRKSIVNNFKLGKIKILTSVNVVSEGFDLPAIEAAILLRPTQSLSLYLQQVGRALRTYEGKQHAIILDHAGNIQRHGLPCLEREWSLDKKIKPVKSTESEPSVKICPQCFGAQTSTNKTCVYCQFNFPVKTKEIEVQDGELKEIDLNAARLNKRIENRSAQTFEELVRLGRQRGYKNPKGWAYFMTQARGKRK
jgi:DNA repair protein RadD